MESLKLRLSLASARLQHFRATRTAMIASLILASVAILLFIYIASLLALDVQNDDLAQAEPLFKLAAILLFLAFFIHAPFAEQNKIATNKDIHFPIHWVRVGIGIMLILLLIQISTISKDSFEFLQSLGKVSHHIQMLLFVSGSACITWGMGGESGLFQRLLSRFRYWANLRNWKVHHFLLLAIVLLASFIRIWNLGEAIPKLVDEIHNVDAVRILFRENVQILRQYSLQSGFTWYFPYFRSLIISLLEPSLFSIRLASVIVGVAQVIAIYHLGSLLFHRRMGLTAALLLATFPPHIHFTRSALENNAGPLFGILMFYFLILGSYSRRPLHYALAGLFLGMTSYFYEADRLLCLPLITGWIIWLFLVSPKSFRPNLPSLRHLLILFLVAFVLIFALYYTWYFHDIPFATRFNSNYSAIIPFWERLLHSERYGLTFVGNLMLDPLVTMVYSRDSTSFYGNYTALILPLLVPFFFVGFLFAFSQIRRVRGSLLFWWLIIAVIGNLIIDYKLYTPRMIVVFPVTALIIALGIEVIISYFIPRRIQMIIVLCVSLALAGYQLVYYFGDHLPNYWMRNFYESYNNDGSLQIDQDDVFLRIAKLPDNTFAHIITNGAMDDLCACIPQRINQFFRRDEEVEVDVIASSELKVDKLLGLDLTKRHVFFLNQDDYGAYALLNANFSISQPIFSPFDIPYEKQMWMYVIQEKSIRSLSEDG